MKNVMLSALIALGVAAAAGAQSADAGETILLRGRVTDTDGNPQRGAVVELWQADVNGNYDHPRDAARGTLLPGFQYYGTSVTDDEGSYAFLTVKPSPYGGRPPHLHFRVKFGGTAALTSQFYFEEDSVAVARDMAAGGAGSRLMLKPDRSASLGSAGVRVLTGDIVVDRNGNRADRLTPTPSQTEGPYYPVVDFSAFDNDLTDPATGQPPVK